MSSCLDELEQDVKRHPHLSFVRIVDDCSTFDLPLFKQFLRSYIDRGIGKMIHIDNLRADRVDHEMLELLKQIGVDHLCIGVESGNPDVFRLVNKGETLDEIISAEGKSSFPGLDLSVSEASCETDDYSSRERTRMQLSAVLMTGCYLLNPLWLGKIFSIVNRYRLWKAFFAGLPLAIRIDTEMAYHRIKCQIATRQWKDLSLLKIPRVIGQEHN